MPITAAAAPACASARRSSIVVMPPDAMTGCACALTARRSAPGPARQLSLAMHGGHEHAGRAAARSSALAARSIDVARRASRAQPCVTTPGGRARRRRRTMRLGIARRGHRREPRGLLDRARADDDARRARGEQRSTRSLVADAAAHLQRAPCASASRLRTTARVRRRGRWRRRDPRRAVARKPGARHGCATATGSAQAHALRVVAAADELHARAVAQVDRRNRDHQPPPRARQAAQEAHARRASSSPGGTARRPCCPPDDGRKAVALVRRPGHHARGVDGAARRSCSRSRHRAAPRIEPAAVRSSSVFQPICGTRGARSRVTRPGMHAEARAGALVARVEQQLHAEADAEARQPRASAARMRSRAGREARRRGAERADAGQHQHVGVERARGSVSIAHLDAGVPRAPCAASAGCPRRSRTRSRASRAAPRGARRARAPSSATARRVMRSASPMPASPRNARTATPRARSRAATAAASAPGRARSSPPTGSGCEARARAAPPRAARGSATASAARARTQLGDRRGARRPPRARASADLVRPARLLDARARSPARRSPSRRAGRRARTPWRACARPGAAVPRRRRARHGVGPRIRRTPRRCSTTPRAPRASRLDQRRAAGRVPVGLFGVHR